MALAGHEDLLGLLEEGRPAAPSRLRNGRALQKPRRWDLDRRQQASRAPGREVRIVNHYMRHPVVCMLWGSTIFSTWFVFDGDLCVCYTTSMHAASENH